MSKKREMGNDSLTFQEQWIKNCLNMAVILDVVHRLRFFSNTELRKLDISVTMWMGPAIEASPF
jgi:hypothetical protein